MRCFSLSGWKFQVICNVQWYEIMLALQCGIHLNARWYIFSLRVLRPLLCWIFLDLKASLAKHTQVLLVLLAERFNWTFLYQFCATCSRNKRCIFSLISNFLAVSIDLEDTTGCFHGCHTVYAQFFFHLLSGDRTSLFMWWYPPRGSDHLRLYTQVRSVGSCHQLSVSLMNSSRLTDRWVIGRE